MVKYDYLSGMRGLKGIWISLTKRLQGIPQKEIEAFYNDIDDEEREQMMEFIDKMKIKTMQEVEETFAKYTEQFLRRQGYGKWVDKSKAISEKERFEKALEEDYDEEDEIGAFYEVAHP